MTDPGTTLGDVIHQQTAELTPAERRVARTLFASNLMAGFDTVTGLAARSGVGRLGDARHRRISTLEHLRKGHTWDDREFPHHPEERGP